MIARKVFTIVTFILFIHHTILANWCNIEDEPVLAYFQATEKITGSIISKEAYIPPNLKECCFRNQDLLFHKIDRANSAIKVLFINALQTNAKEKAYAIKVLPEKKYLEYLEEKQLVNAQTTSKLNSHIREYEIQYNVKLPRFAEYLGFGESEKKNPTHYWILMEMVKGLTFNQIKEKLEICNFNEQEAISIGKEIGTQIAHLMNFCQAQKDFYLDLDNFSARNTLYDLESKQLSFIDLGKLKLASSQTKPSTESTDFLILWQTFFPHNVHGDYKIRNDSPHYSKEIFHKNKRNIHLRILIANALLNSYLHTVNTQNSELIKGVHKSIRKLKNTIKTVFKESAKEELSFLFDCFLNENFKYQHPKVFS